MVQARKVQSEPKTHLLTKRLQEGTLIFFVAIGAFLAISLSSYHQADPGWSIQAPVDMVHNLGGRAGAWFSDVLFVLFGYVAFLFPLGMLYAGYLVFSDRERPEHPLALWLLKIGGFVLSLISISTLLSLHLTTAKHLPMNSGGLIGFTMNEWLLPNFNPLGTTVLMLGGSLIGLTWLTGVSWVRLMDLIGHYGLKGLAIFGQGAQTTASQFEVKAKQFFEKYSIAAFKEWLAARRQSKPIINTAEQSTAVPGKASRLLSMLQAKKSPPVPAEPDITSMLEPTLPETRPEPVEAVSMPIPVVEEAPACAAPSAISAPITKPAKKKEADVQSSMRKNTNDIVTPTGQHQAPSLSLLTNADKKGVAGYSKTQLEALSRLVEQRLREFGIDVKVVEVSPGPVITRFEMELAAGVKVSRITNLAKDLARALSVVSVRVVEVIPGRPVVGLEIPNVQREIVRLKDILASSSYQDKSSPLTIALGKDIAGNTVCADLAKMPHLLVAGTTGSGKSVGVNAMILSFLYKATPKEVRLILIDPKMLELSVYDNIPHLLAPVVTDMKDAANSLRWCVAEMERRYQLMAALGVRNVTGFNDKVSLAAKQGNPIADPLWIPTGQPDEQAPFLDTIPYIVVVVDEFADMMMVVGKKVEELIARIAQKARAAGIHLILATQRPSVDVITGLIKANIPTRIAFQVSSKIDSRTILDQSGAEQLLGQGDMLYLPPGVGIPTRVHGAFVTDEEVHSVVADWRSQGEPDYIESLTQTSSIPGYAQLSDASQSDHDPLYDKAIEIVVESRRPSISHVQRRLKIGYNRAARLIEQMEADGIVSEMQTNGSREVLAPPPMEE